MLVEAEIWPNFLWRARDLKIPVFLANARLSDRSYPRLQTVWLSVPAAVRVVRRRRLPERGGRRAAARGRLPARSRPRRRQPEIRRGEAGRTPHARRAGAAAAARRAAGRADSGRRAARTTARKSFWRKSRSGCGRVSRNCFSCSCRGISSAATNVGRQVARARREICLSQCDRREHATGRRRGRMPAGQHDRRTAIFLRARDGGVRRQKPDGHRRAEPDRAGRAGQGDGVRAEHAEFRRHHAELSRAKTPPCR